ncbi:LytTR family transcriptional regulator DNA-binding domain-containing protein [Spirosoma flavum]|uniref:LytTR family transcriptional regulator DNA-binding domain-containing protein n=1 Tax=Spirosoma flavum TaxID=2048557 RepID=A0ABW6AHE1_9BACT
MTFGKLTTNTLRITYLMGWGNYTRIFLADSPPELNATTLKKCVDTLPGFIRLSKSLAVNPTHITQVRRNNDRSAGVLVAGIWLQVSRRRVPLVVRQLRSLPGNRVKGLVEFSWPIEQASQSQSSMQGRTGNYLR